MGGFKLLEFISSQEARAIGPGIEPLGIEDDSMIKSKSNEQGSKILSM